MAVLTARFSSNRAVREYTEQYYLPAAVAFRSRRARNCAVGRQIAQWRARLFSHWSDLRFSSVETDSGDNAHEFRVQIFIGALQPDDVRVEVYAEPQTGTTQANWPMTRDRTAVGDGFCYRYLGQVPADRPLSDYTARVVPAHSAAAVPLEAPMILWQPRA